ncbi:MAG: hypothetical protein HZB22_03030 [Deltaproteobacteria bacterium]|nr:hypothetical protein [Deltaproteobacteria bacterium]
MTESLFSRVAGARYKTPSLKRGENKPFHLQRWRKKSKPLPPLREEVAYRNPFPLGGRRYSIS